MGQHHTEEGLSHFHTVMIYVGYGILMILGSFWEFIARIVFLVTGKQNVTMRGRSLRKGYAPLFVPEDYFYVTWLYKRISDCWDRPICSVAGTYIDVLERTSDDINGSYTFTGNKIKSLNLGSYNYLGFAENSGSIIEKDIKSLHEFCSSNCASSLEGGYTNIQKELEITIAEFVGKESAIVFEMGYATNSTTLPALVRKGALVISDSLNHASLVMGLRATGAHIKVFKHDDTVDLERVLRSAIAQGQPGSGTPYTMILIVVEGIYSMEGIICKLPEIIRIKKKYKAFLYVDEAHSIGALGPRGRGVCDYFNVNPAEVDILMGTFTKSFASVGGYIAGSKELVAHLRAGAFGTIYANSMSAVCAQQTLSALHVIMGKDGTDTGAKKIQQLKENSNYFRTRLRQMGFLTLGTADSPVVPLMLYHPGKFAGFSRLLLERGIAAVVVAFPATTKTTGRARFCLSAGHTREDLDFALRTIEEIGEECDLKYCQSK
jgi:serine palmitoyltransferase